MCRIGKKAAPIADRIINSKRSVKICCFLLVGVICIVAGLAAVGATVAYKVTIGDEVIATVKNKQQYASALDIIKQKVDGIDVEKAVSKPRYSPILVLSSGIDSDEDVAVSIIETTDEIVAVKALVINGETAAYTKDIDLDAALLQHKNSFLNTAGECVLTFVDDIKSVDAYCVVDDITADEDVNALVAGLNVRSETTFTSEVSVPYTTTYKKVSTRTIGDSAVIKKGANGLRRMTQRVVAVNGGEVERTTLSDEVVTAPVSAVVEVGTAKSTASAAHKAEAYSSGFIFPLPAGTWRVSSYYGDGRNHKGVDLCAAKGVSIYAAKAGTVTFAGYDGAYGYCVVVDHGNGYSTRYAHASTLCVSKGETVSAGTALAKVGSTGRSTGNHLHFEVIKNGKRVDPAPYIGLA